MKSAAEVVDSAHSALTLAVVVRVAPVAALRPGAGERPAARLAADETAQREVRVTPLPWTGHHNAAVEDSLSGVERRLVHERLEVALRGHAVVGAFDLPGVDRVPHHLAEALRRDRQPILAAQAGGRDARSRPVSQGIMSDFEMATLRQRALEA